MIPQLSKQQARAALNQFDSIVSDFKRAFGHLNVEVQYATDAMRRLSRVAEGLPQPRASKGWRKHIRRLKASQRNATS